MSEIDKVLGSLDEEPAIMVSIDVETIQRAREELAQLRAAVDEASTLIKRMIGVMPDSRHAEDESWEWCWDDLSGDAQELVKNQLGAACKWLAANEETK